MILIARKLHFSEFVVNADPLTSYKRLSVSDK